MIACTTAIVAIGLNMGKLKLSNLYTYDNPDFKMTSEYRQQLQGLYSKLIVVADFYLENGKVVDTSEFNTLQNEALSRIGILDQDKKMRILSDDFIYYVSNGEDYASNSTYQPITLQYLKEHFNTYYYHLENRTYASDGMSENLLGSRRYYDLYVLLGIGSKVTNDNIALTIYLAPKNEYLQKNQEQLTSEVTQAKKIILLLIPLFAFLFILILLQIIITGKSDKKEPSCNLNGKNPNRGRFFIEVVMLEMLACILLGSILISTYPGFWDFIGFFTSRFLVFQFIFGISFSVLFGLFFLGFLYIVRRLKEKNFIRSSMVYLGLKKIVGLAAKFWRNYILMDSYKNHAIPKRMFLRQIAFFSLMGAGFLIAIAFSVNGSLLLGILMLLFLFLLLFLYIYQNNQDFSELSILCEHIEQLYTGNNEFHSTVSPNSLVSVPAMQLNNISAGFKKSVEQQVKAERNKIDLVTNVSHDLKTPLTSIIGYIDLLSKQELNPEASDYVKILEIKTERLKRIVSDLFELARITSGSEELVLEKLDCAVLVKQVLADMEDAILASKKSFKMDIIQESVFIHADGSKLYRIYQNLLDNALKYSMEGTRIFVELKVIGDQVMTMIKNTASYDLNFNTDDILERFTRGDPSRSGEGNGLGLSIAKGFANACGGDLQVNIDGDLFKVTVTFPTISEQ